MPWPVACRLQSHKLPAALRPVVIIALLSPGKCALMADTCMSLPRISRSIAVRRHKIIGPGWRFELRQACVLGLESAPYPREGLH